MSQDHGDLCSLHGQTRKHALANMKGALARGSARRCSRACCAVSGRRRYGSAALHEGFGLPVEAVHYSLRSLV